MAHNALPNNIGDLIKLGNKMVGGLAALGQTLEITQLTAASLKAQLAAYAEAQSIYNIARDARQKASTACTDIHANIGEWLLKARDVLVPYLGRAWSAAWIPAGFVDHSTAVPPYVGDQLNLLGLLSTYLAANPDYEDPKVGVTGAAGEALKKSSNTADDTFSAAKTAATEKLAARDTALEALKGSMRMLTRILDELLAADDPRWTAFGLNIPDSDVTPAAPTNLTVNIADGPVLMASCNVVPLATRYRWRIKLVGVEADFRLAASTKSPLAQLDKVLPGQSVELMVQAANPSAQSVPSESVFVTLPTVAERTPSVKTASNGSGETVAGYTSTQASTGNGFAAESNGATRGSRNLESNGARH